MIDPLVSLAFSIYSNPGVYALLLGSGVSRSAGIPTGWEIVLNLIRSIAHLQGSSADPTPEQWYKDNFHCAPRYADLLDQLTSTSAERSNVLRPYFEPSDEERQRNEKIPSAAHRAIAELMKGGFHSCRHHDQF